jgi:hypothetical protein
MRGRLRASEPLNVHADGILIGTLPVEIEAVPNAIRVVMPDRAETGGRPGASVTPEPEDPRPAENRE